MQHYVEISEGDDHILVYDNDEVLMSCNDNSALTRRAVAAFVVQYVAMLECPLSANMTISMNEHINQIIHQSGLFKESKDE